MQNYKKILFLFVQKYKIWFYYFHRIACVFINILNAYFIKSNLKTLLGDLDQCSNEVMLFRLRGPLSFGAAKGITERMMLVRNYKVLILDVTDVPRLGVTATLAIEDMVQEAKTNSRKAYVATASGRVRERLERFGVEGVVGTRLEALQAAVSDLGN